MQIQNVKTLLFFFVLCSGIQISYCSQTGSSRSRDAHTKPAESESDVFYDCLDTMEQKNTTQKNKYTIYRETLEEELKRLETSSANNKLLDEALKNNRSKIDPQIPKHHDPLIAEKITHALITFNKEFPSKILAIENDICKISMSVIKDNNFFIPIWCKVCHLTIKAKNSMNKFNQRLINICNSVTHLRSNL